MSSKRNIPFIVDLPGEGGETAGAATASPEPAGRPGPGEDAPPPIPREPAAPREGTRRDGPPVLSVGQLTRRIRGLLEESFPVLGVEGELSNVRIAASGHIYFVLKDSEAQIRCVMFRNAAASLRFDPEEGLQVVLRGRISVYEARGEYQIQVMSMEPQGVGALQLAFEQLKQRLGAEGLFEPAHKQALPFLPRRIGIVTSPTGAAIRDMLHVLERRFPGMPVLICPATVQGDRAAGEIARGIATLNRLAQTQKIDLIIVGRGGGSVEDLWAFNEEEVARAIFASRVPVISAVGHEVDFTIADFVADVRAPTPSAAAEIAVPDRAGLRAQVEDLRTRLFERCRRELAWRAERWTSLRARLTSPEMLMRQHAMRLDDLTARLMMAGRGGVREAAQRLNNLRARLLLLRPDRVLAMQREALNTLHTRLAPAMLRGLRARREGLAAQMELLDTLSPLAVMGRGYGLVRDGQGRLLRSVGQVAPGDTIHVRVEDGGMDATVQRIHPGGGDTPDDGAE